MKYNLVYYFRFSHSIELNLIDNKFNINFCVSFCLITAIFSLTWFLMTPFIIFQALLCARDDGRMNQISVSAAMTPVLVLLGWGCLCTVVVVFRTKSPFQV